MVVVTYYREAIVNNHPPLVAVEASTGFSMVGVPDPFSSRPNIKEEKVVWLCETTFNVLISMADTAIGTGLTGIKAGVKAGFKVNINTSA